MTRLIDGRKRRREVKIIDDVLYTYPGRNDGRGKEIVRKKERFSRVLFFSFLKTLWLDSRDGEKSVFFSRYSHFSPFFSFETILVGEDFLF